MLQHQFLTSKVYEITIKREGREGVIERESETESEGNRIKLRWRKRSREEKRERIGQRWSSKEIKRF